MTPIAWVLKAEGIPFLLSSAYEAAKFGWDVELAGAINIGKPASREKLLAALESILKVSNEVPRPLSEI